MTKTVNDYASINHYDQEVDVKLCWIRQAEKRLLGRQVVGISYSTDGQVKKLGWESAAIVLHFDDGSFICPSGDDEGNDAGALFGWDASGAEFEICVI